jgi:ABC-type nitrate/sulfonate/bicarbonate transport system ATPase subunit
MTSPERSKAVSAHNVGLRFMSEEGALQVLEKVSLQVEHGQLACIVGPSGCGKTSLLKLLVGLLKPSEGTIYVDPALLKGGAAYVQQSAPLLPWRTMLQNAALGLEVRSELTQARRQFLEALISEFGLKGFESSATSALSGGMKQRVAVIQALASKPRLLFCDEPFSAIDFVTRLELNTRFKFMCSVEAITTIFVTHNIEEAIFLGDVIFVMSGRPGRIVETYYPALSIGGEDAVRCRESPEFATLFMKIWSDLKERHVAT